LKLDFKFGKELIVKKQFKEYFKEKITFKNLIINHYLRLNYINKIEKKKTQKL
jgi:hypothetical protein